MPTTNSTVDAQQSKTFKRVLKENLGFINISAESSKIIGDLIVDDVFAALEENKEETGTSTKQALSAKIEGNDQLKKEVGDITASALFDYSKSIAIHVQKGQADYPAVERSLKTNARRLRYPRM